MSHTIQELHKLQGLPLKDKIEMTRERIKAWVDHWGLENVCVSFSGGKDSTVLLDIARKDYPDIEAFYVSTGLEFPEIESFVRSFDNVTITKPKMNFVEVIKKYGYPILSKEISECVSGAKSYLKSLTKEIEAEQSLTDRQTDRQTDRHINISTINYADSESMLHQTRGGNDRKYRKIRGIGEFTKRTDAQKTRGSKSEISDNVRDANERSEDTGEYP